MIKLSDYVIDFFVKKGIDTVFLVSGGGIMHLLDSVGRNPKIHYFANRHEQASATCAESWARISGKPGVCLVTTGPGSTNAITGVAAAWVDSIPMIVISGQVKTSLIADYKKQRQKGPQEVNIIPMVKPITKYAKTITSLSDIHYELEKAYTMACSGRPGPVWINIPLDIQASKIKRQKKLYEFNILVDKPSDKDIKQMNNLLTQSSRPLFIFGNGIRLSHSINLMERIIDQYHIPVVLPFNGLDLLSEDNAMLVGKFGPGGQRRGNFALQNADLILSVGASLNIASTGFDVNTFGRSSKKIIVNVDKGELDNLSFATDLKIQSDAEVFLRTLYQQLQKNMLHIDPLWLQACLQWKRQYPSLTKESFKDVSHVNSYVFMDKLSDKLDNSNILVTGIALDAVSMYQAFKVKKGQRAFVNKNFGQMGWDLPAAIGACIANNRKKTVCVTGDGSIQLNIQELGTIAYYRLPIKIFVFNNGGYESIRATQNNLFNGLHVGSDNKTGVDNPDFKKLADAYHFRYLRIASNNELIKKLDSALLSNDPMLCELNISFDQIRSPKASTYIDKNGKLQSKPLEDMYPFLPEKEIIKNMTLFRRY